MYRTHFVLSLLLLYAGLAHSFEWEIVLAKNTQLYFYDKNGSLTHTVSSPTGGTPRKLIHDPAHNRVLFSDDFDIVSFDIDSNTTKTLYYTSNSFVDGFAYDPVLDLIFWSESNGRIYSASLKPGFNNPADLKQSILMETADDMVFDICGGFIYWISNLAEIVRAQCNGSHREIIAKSVSRYDVNIDQQEQKLYWYGWENGFTYDWIKCTDLNRSNSRRLHQVAPQHSKDNIHQLTISKDHIYWKICAMYVGNCSIWKIPKNALNGPDETKDLLVDANLFNVSAQYISAMTVKYNIEDVTRGVHNCDRLKSLLPNNVDESLLCVHGTKVSGESRCDCAQGYSGERCDVSVCHNYCFQGDCSVSAEGEPKCRCKAGYSGTRCEVNVCQGYCLNDGVCTLNENIEPMCQCAAGFEGSRCDVSKSLINCIQTCIRNTGIASATDEGATSTPTRASTVF